MGDYDSKETNENEGQGQTGKRVNIKPPPGLKCRFCKIINEKRLPAYINSMQFTQGEWDHLIFENNLDIMFPDRCGEFFKLSIKDRETVLNDTGFCTECAIEKKYHKDSTYKEVWERNKTKESKTIKIRCGAENCFKHWSMCPEHRERNQARYEKRTKDCKWQFPVPPQGIHENAINHFWDQSNIIEAQVDITPPPIDMPQPPVMYPEQTLYFDNHQHIELPLPVEFTPRCQRTFSSTNLYPRLVKT